MLASLRSGPGARGAVPKVFRHGTHRAAVPEATLARVARFMPVMGITRIANATGLDSIGIPVAMVCRPNSRSLSVFQGKGLSLAAAKASGLMEAIETWHAERIALPLKLATYEEMRYTHRVVDVEALPRVAPSLFHPNRPLLWIEGHDLLQDQPAWVPFELVHTNYTLPLPTGSGCFTLSSNGLASGNHVLEAISHGLCEVVERDATTLWHAADEDARSRTRLALDSVDDPDCRWALDRFERAGVEVAAWETTTEVGIPAFLCTIAERADDPLRLLYAASGMGCHPAREVALLRALTEAAQSRLTLIAGSRDDTVRARYEAVRDPEVLRQQRARLLADGPRRSFREVPTRDGETLEDDVGWELERLQAVGFSRVVVVDLTRPEFRVPVVRLIVPGLEGSLHVPGYAPGRRARRQAAGEA